MFILRLQLLKLKILTNVALKAAKKTVIKIPAFQTKKKTLHKNKRDNALKHAEINLRKIS
jgi:hypothetical protein